MWNAPVPTRSSSQVGVSRGCEGGTQGISRRGRRSVPSKTRIVRAPYRPGRDPPERCGLAHSVDSVEIAAWNSPRLARRLTAGRWTLDPEMVVRIHPGQLSPTQSVERVGGSPSVSSGESSPPPPPLSRAEIVPLRPCYRNALLINYLDDPRARWVGRGLGSKLPIIPIGLTETARLARTSWWRASGRFGRIAIRVRGYRFSQQIQRVRAAPSGGKSRALRLRVRRPE